MGMEKKRLTVQIIKVDLASECVKRKTETIR